MDLAVDNLTKSFSGAEGRGGLEVLAGVDLAVERGRFVSLVGPSGCGKTTLLRIIAGLEPATGGRVLLAGRPVRAASARVGLVFQQYALFPWRTTLGNIEMGLEMRGMAAGHRRQRAREYLRAFGLAGFEHSYPKELSGGMQQRVAIARTLIMEPRLVLMDEPFGSLDSQTRNSLQEFLLDIWGRRGDTVIFVTHNVDEAVFLSDEVAVLSGRPARVVATFPVEAPRPRDRTSVECNRLRRSILELLERQRAEAPEPEKGRGP
jgi:NitT/TauT family transport system ATP-binding protein